MAARFAEYIMPRCGMCGAETAIAIASVLCEAISESRVGDCFAKSARSDKAEVSGQLGRACRVRRISRTIIVTEELLDYISRPDPYVVRVAGHIALPADDDMYHVTSDKTIVGLGSSAVMRGAGINRIHPYGMDKQ